MDKKLIKAPKSAVPRKSDSQEKHQLSHSNKKNKLSASSTTTIKKKRNVTVDDNNNGRCMVKSCLNSRKGNSTKERGGISFHDIPDRKLFPQRHLLWTRNCLKSASYSKNAAICSAHFEKDQFYERDGVKYLRKGAIPTVFNIPQNVKDRRTKMVLRKGKCHCGAVEYMFKAPMYLTNTQCNCSQCQEQQKVRYLVSAENFTVEKGAKNLTEYAYNSLGGKRLFCKTCGSHCFSRPECTPDAYAISIGICKGMKIEKIDTSNQENELEGEDVEESMEGADSEEESMEEDEDL